MAKIGFIEMGNIGSTAILNGLLRVYKPEDLLFTAATKKNGSCNRKTGVVHATSNAECVKESEYVIPGSETTGVF